MKLTRRDALGALGAAGITSTAGCSSLVGSGTDGANGGGTVSGETEPIEALLALTEVLYPSDVEVKEEFIDTYMFGRIHDEEELRAQLQAGVETLDSLAKDEHGAPFGVLDTEQRVSVIQATDLRTGASDHEGTDVERTNYYLIDELLFAFYGSPKGGELVGNTNPPGWPGGFGYSPEPSQ